MLDLMEGGGAGYKGMAQAGGQELEIRDTVSSLIISTSAPQIWAGVDALEPHDSIRHAWLQRE